MTTTATAAPVPGYRLVHEHRQGGALLKVWRGDSGTTHADLVAAKDNTGIYLHDCNTGRELAREVQWYGIGRKDIRVGPVHQAAKVRISGPEGNYEPRICFL
ncbi:hypothetical protein NLX83_15605 [Allokutzneria sp. A3M-2-11 16]|uniref:hypothetical protein n=1 Tax=Allokutzneria sp. A3M-2-11 16 TaxID=2962043 RepID=UPI0020B79B22|nr:hypothetical protein [Allokutzneria sp. A3M-2-11 16]MCP3800693.1 hypothetical protein [Allokutzneria sp. A3M-2-11 16]